MKQPLKFSFILFLLAIFAFASVFFTDSSPSFAQEGVGPDGESRYPPDDEGQSSDEDLNSSGQETSVPYDEHYPPPILLEHDPSDVARNSDSSVDRSDQLGEINFSDALGFYSDRSTFNDDFPGLPIEDFESGNVGVTIISCNAPVDSSTDDGTCFDQGDILPTLQLSDNPGPSPAGLAYVGGGFLVSGSPAPSNALLTNYRESLDIIFTEDTVYQVGMDVFTYFSGGTVDITVYAEGDVQIGADNVSTTTTTGTFWGVSSDQPITRINLLSPETRFEVVDNISFGNIPATANPGGFLYVFEEIIAGNNLIHIFKEDKSSGVLTEIADSPKDTGGTGSINFLSEHIAYDSINNRLFVSNNGNDTLSGFSVNQATGILTEMFTPVSIGTGNWHGICVHPSGSHVIVGDTGGLVKSFSIDSNSATEADSKTGSPANWGCDFTTDGAYLFQSGTNSGNFSSYSFDKDTGKLTHLGIHNPGSADFVAFPELDSSNRLFMAGFDTGNLFAFTTSSGIPVKVSGPIASGITNGNHAVLHPNGYFYIVDRDTNQVGASQITGDGAGTTFVVISGSPFSTGAKPGGSSHILALGYNNSLLYTANAVRRNVTSFSLDKSTGYLKFLTIQSVNSAGITGRLTGMVYVDYIRANFTGNPTSGRVNHTVNFTNLSEGPYTSCLWKFGDGSESTSCGNPPHTYKKVGTFNVSLKVSSPGGSHTRTRSTYVTVTDVVADFTGSPTSGRVNHTVNFTNNSLGDYTACSWIFGDGGTSTNCSNPSHTYKKVGTYNVSLTLSVSGGGDSKTRNGYITVTNVVADFTGSPTSGRVNHTVNFTNKSVGDYTACSWNFGDGGTSTSCGNPSRIYKKPGTYNVSLNVSVSGGGDSKTRTGYITVSNVVADFTATPTSGPVNLTVKFTNKSLGDYTTCSWEFGDGSKSTTCGSPSHTYKSTGKFTVKLTVSGTGFTNPKTRTDYINVQNASVFFPSSVSDFCGGFNGPREWEGNTPATSPSNNSGVDANGPLCFSYTYIGSPDDDYPDLESDYFYFYSNGGPITVSVTNFVKSNAQVQLKYQVFGGDPVIFQADQASGSYILHYTGPAGKYFIRVVAGAGHPKDNGDYTLEVTKP